MPAIKNASVNQGLFSFLGAKIWLLISAYWYENLSGYATALHNSMQVFTFTTKLFVSKKNETFDELDKLRRHC